MAELELHGRPWEGKEGEEKGAGCADLL
jgi:hypothetical protein